ncbi:MAG: hypothetical protein JJE35_10620 [Thermoleophilia bacterium]|nr:hypothetical protein [Thermoleophilia bacterium]
MSILMVQEFEVEEDDLSTPNYDSVSARLNVKGDPPPGLIVHTAGFTGRGVFRIANVWESEEDWQRFRDGRLAEALKPMMESGDGTPPSEEYTYQLHDLIKP